MAGMAHMDECTASREKGGELREAQCNQHDDDGTDDPAADTQRTGDTRGVMCAEQPARANHAGRAGKQKPYDSGVAPEFAFEGQA